MVFHPSGEPASSSVASITAEGCCKTPPQGRLEQRSTSEMALCPRRQPSVTPTQKIVELALSTANVCQPCPWSQESWAHIPALQLSSRKTLGEACKLCGSQFSCLLNGHSTRLASPVCCEAPIKRHPNRAPSPWWHSVPMQQLSRFLFFRTLTHHCAIPQSHSCY